MLLLRIKIILLSILVIVLSSGFILYKVDLYNKEKDLELLKTQIISTSNAAFDVAYITGQGVNAHIYDIINSIKQQKNIKDLWISRSDDFSAAINKPKSTLRDQVERNVYTSKSNEISLKKINDSNNHSARISVPIIATNKCTVCHNTIKRGEVIGAVNASVFLQDNIIDIAYWAQNEFLMFLAVASFFLMFMLMVSIGQFTRLSANIKSAILAAINGDFTLRVKNRLTGMSEITKLTNRLMEALDKNLSSIDTKIASIFIYNRSVYNKNPLIRLSEVMNEIVALFAFKNKIDSLKQVNDIYKEIQLIIQKYIKYKNLTFAEISNGEIVSGYKIENEATMKVVSGEITTIQKRLNDENKNIIFHDDKGSEFISTSLGGLNVIDLKFVISEKLMVYYSIALNSKKELNEKEKSITRIYNYMREARHIINTKMLMKEIEENSYTDPLTKAFNRFFLDKYSADIKAKIDRNFSFGILMLDIDHFKNINDTYGHAVGDAGIILLVETIRKIIRPIDRLIRYGGEEFVVILDETYIDEATKIAEKIRTAFMVAKKCSRGNLDFPKSVSIGVSAMPEFSSDVWECINQADLALYEAKEGGRNQVVTYSMELKARADEKKAEAERIKKEEAEAKKAADAAELEKSGISADGDDDDFLESLKFNNQI